MVVVVPPAQAGFYQTMVMVFVGYSVVILTVLSISAIATSSTVEGGGVYCILLIQIFFIILYGHSSYRYMYTDHLPKWVYICTICRILTYFEGKCMGAIGAHLLVCTVRVFNGTALHYNNTCIILTFWAKRLHTQVLPWSWV